jgi:hypothetical protein
MLFYCVLQHKEKRQNESFLKIRRVQALFTLKVLIFPRVSAPRCVQMLSRKEPECDLTHQQQLALLCGWSTAHGVISIAVFLERAVLQLQRPVAQLWLCSEV